jgi:hypothetical protein
MTVLPNMRLLGTASAQDGRDWDQLVRNIDQVVEAQNFDLAEETVVIEFQEGAASVYRPVIGGVRELPAPWQLVDRTAGETEVFRLEENNWEDLMEEVGELRPENAGGFTLLLKRRMAPELKLSVEVFFRFF